MLGGQFRVDAGVKKDIMLNLGLDASSELYAPFFILLCTTFTTII